MHAGKAYGLAEFLLWTRRNLVWPLIISIIAVALYQLAGFRWLAIPWTVVALLGGATAFIAGFKNVQTYNRTWEARQIWGGVMSNSRAWGIMCRDFLSDKQLSRDLIYRQFAWLTALRYQLRTGRKWETSDKAYSREYRKYYSVPETETPLEQELAKYISGDELDYILTTKNKAGQILSLQGRAVKELYESGLIDGIKFSDMHKAVRDFYEHQGRSERIKNFPYPRQYATINTLFVRLFCFMLPFGLLGEFDKLNVGMTGFLHGRMVWLVIPLSILVAWVYTSLEQVGESTENPFEGGANDVPISQLSRAAEIDIMEFLGETDLPLELQPQNNIVL